MKTLGPASQHAKEHSRALMIMQVDSSRYMNKPLGQECSLCPSCLAIRSSLGCLILSILLNLGCLILSIPLNALTLYLNLQTGWMDGLKKYH